ncbi:MAG: cyclic nucleotide-binding domain-containing protein [Pseudomonadota bacterium]
MEDMLQLTGHLPEVHYDPGDIIITEGGDSDGVWILVSGSLRVLKKGEEVNTVTLPGALIGEMSILLDIPDSATVEAAEPSVMRYAEDGAALLESDPRIIRLVAVGLAERLNFVTSYLADLQQQYSDSPGIAMVPEVLRQLSQRQGPPARPGSARDPDPEY